MPARIFGHDPRHEKVQKIIFTAGLGAAAAHFESAKGMAADDRARARTVYVDVASFQSGFHTLNVRVDRRGEFRIRARPGYWASQ